MDSNYGVTEKEVNKDNIIVPVSEISLPLLRHPSPGTLDPDHRV